MGKKEGYQSPVYRHPGRGKRRSPCVQNSRKPDSQWVRPVPAIPSWEKEFCYKIGLFKWENFLEAKKNTWLDEKVMDWNDSAAKEAFDNAKNMFFANINNNGRLSQEKANTTYNSQLPSPDLYIDEINWDDDGDHQVNQEILREIEMASVKDLQMCSNIPILDMKPTATGWEDDDGVEKVYFSSGKVLTGLIVGDHV
ncbi:hypothetical protein DH2020_024724 [Rehmannia glutinosa]|uniref:Uncharacterized protein n=1 Tax=Rehmannia glutinosa TaxID=99300 RepID=A0ABR0W2J9_REHGL